MDNLADRSVKSGKKLNPEGQTSVIELSIEILKAQYENLVSTISETRNVCNYIITGLLAFTGFVISKDNLLNSTFQKVIIYGLLSFILLAWFMINWSITIPNSLNTSFIPNVINKHYEKGTDEEIKAGIYKAILKTMQESYLSTSKQLDKLERKKKVFFKICGIYFILLILFINLPNIKINF